MGQPLALGDCGPSSRPLRAGRKILAADASEDPFEEAAAGLFDGARDAEQLGLGGIGAGDRLAVVADMNGSARSGGSRGRRRGWPRGSSRPSSRYRRRWPVCWWRRAHPWRQSAKGAVEVSWVPTSSVRGIAQDNVGDTRGRSPIPRGYPWYRGARNVLDALHRVDRAIRGDRAWQGAKPTPQLPITTVLTPCHSDGASCGSQVTCPS